MAMPPIPSLTGGAGGDSGDSQTQGGAVGGSPFDSSGWNVTFGSNSGIESSRSQSTPLDGYMEYLPYVVVGTIGLLALKWIKKKKS